MQRLDGNGAIIVIFPPLKGQRQLENIGPTGKIIAAINHW